MTNEEHRHHAATREGAAQGARYLRTGHDLVEWRARDTGLYAIDRGAKAVGKAVGHEEVQNCKGCVAEGAARRELSRLLEEWVAYYGEPSAHILGEDDPDDDETDEDEPAATGELSEDPR